MDTKPAAKTRLLAHASDSRCQQCPPDRVCAWGCVQGTNTADIVTGAALEQTSNWALNTSTPAEEPTARALMEVYNG